MVCANYDVAGVLVLQERLVPAQPILRNWGPSIKDCFEILRPHIAEMQKTSNSGPSIGTISNNSMSAALAMKPPKRFTKDRD